ncbi:hypothetical protein ACNS7O_00435 [Haloferacaceae archaeon DSL9]
MGKVSVGLRGWRFEESEIFTDEGEYKPLEEIPLDPRQRLIRLTQLVEKPCDACYLIHGEENKRRCRQAEIVYGEPGDEVVLCAQHEPDLIYWYQEAGGSALRGEPEFADAFHEWVADGGRAPDGFGAVEHVETDPKGLPTPPDAREIRERLEADYEPERINLRKYMDDDDEEETGEEISEEDLDGLDLGTSYPKRNR